ncbi:MAG: hypothetical protein PHU85_03650 [Phycisphaerae bacterium]|nr:hypothetical protein [Phycisphaerae bacterium]
MTDPNNATPSTPPANQPAAPAATKSIDIRVKAVPDQVIFRGYWKLMFVWPVIALGYLFYFLDKWHWASPETLFWIWAIVLIIVLVTMGVDMGRNMTVFWIVLIALFWVSIMYLKKVLGWTVFTSIHNFISNLAAPYPTKGALFISIVLTVVYAVMIVWVRLNQTWRFTNNEFEHFVFGRSDDSLSRGAKKVKVSYHDFFEMLLCLSGTIVISNSTGTRDMRVIENVPLAPLRWRKIDRMLAATAVTGTADDDDAGDDEA